MRGLAICGFKPQLIIGPIYSDKLVVTDELVLLYTDNKQSIDVYNTVVSNLHDKINSIIGKKINDIFNFYELYFTVLNIIKDKNIDWINVTSGPGIALTAISLAISGSKKSNINRIKYVYYHEPKNNMPGQTDIIDPINVNIFNLKNRKKSNTLFFNIFNELYNYSKVRDITIASMALKFKKSQSTVSRAINLLIEMQFVKYSGSGHGNSKKVFELTPCGKNINEYIHQYYYS